MRLLIVAFVMVVSTSGWSQTKIEGIVMPNVMKVGQQYLKLNGGGVREKLFIDLYIACLYLKEKSTSASHVINSNEPMAMKLRIVSGMVDNDNFEEALREGFEKSTGGDISGIKDRMETLIDVGFKEDIETGDIYDIVYLPKKGCTLSKNNEFVVTIKGLDFKKALFGVWFCDEPADESLKKDMLGK